MTRWGKFRPFFLFGAAPLMLLAFATFTLPGLVQGSGTALLLAYLTYGLLGLAYSLVNIPYGSLASAMTQRPDERGRLASFRMIGTALTGILLAFVVAPQVKRYTGDPDGFQHSLAITMGIFAVVGFGLYMFLFATSRETVQRDVASVSMRQSFNTLKHNRPLVMLCLASLAFLTALFSLQTVQVYYARDVLGNATLLTVLTILSVGSIFIIAPFIPRLVVAIGKKKAFLGFGVIGVVAGVGISLTALRRVGPARVLRPDGHLHGRRQHPHVGAGGGHGRVRSGRRVCGPRASPTPCSPSPASSARRSVAPWPPSSSGPVGMSVAWPPRASRPSTPSASPPGSPRRSSS